MSSRLWLNALAQSDLAQWEGGCEGRGRVGPLIGVAQQRIQGGWLFRSADACKRTLPSAVSSAPRRGWGVDEQRGRAVRDGGCETCDSGVSLSPPAPGKTTSSYPVALSSTQKNHRKSQRTLRSKINWRVGVPSIWSQHQEENHTQMETSLSFTSRY
ncbi:uncharacterized protein [Nothobranchius furzeri]|uniref:uncharacterized protein n=1 Tax=Nothobranchius furzeri TaxID=105023 RepID=UPI0039048F83